jgi:hypothetical protein
MDAGQLHTLFAEIGPLFDLDQVSAFDGEESWAVVLGGTVVSFELDPERAILVLSSEVGQPAAEARAAVHEAALQYGLAWRETGGARLALDGPGGTLVLIYELATAGLDTARLAGVTGQFAGVARGWQELLARAPTSSMPTPPGGFDPARHSGAIRA